MPGTSPTHCTSAQLSTACNTDAALTVLIGCFSVGGCPHPLSLPEWCKAKLLRFHKDCYHTILDLRNNQSNTQRIHHLDAVRLERLSACPLVLVVVVLKPPEIVDLLG